MREQKQKPPFWRRESARWGLTLGAILLMMAMTVWMTPGLLGGSAEQEPAAEAAAVTAPGEEVMADLSADTPEPGLAEGNAASVEEAVAEDEAEAGASAADGEALEAADDDVLAVSGVPMVWAMPISGNISRAYGYDFNPSTEDYRFHRGCDIDVAAASPVRAVAAGTVLSSGKDEYWGGIVIIDHGGGWKSIYKCLQPSVTIGQAVATGDLIGSVIVAPAEGVQKAHLHFELECEGDSLDPLAFL